jgi:hypothetical protein
LISRIIFCVMLGVMGLIGLFPETPEPPKPLTGAQIQMKSKLRSIETMCEKRKSKKPNKFCNSLKRTKNA